MINYDSNTDSFVGAVQVATPLGMVPVIRAVPLRPIAKAIAQRLLKREMRVAGVVGDEVGFFGFLKKAFSKVWNAAKKVAKAIGLTKLVAAVKKGVQKVVKWAGKVIQSPVFGAIVGVASFIPGIGPVVAGGYAATKAAIAVADGVTRGDPKALATVGKLATGPNAQRAMALINSVKA